VIDAVGPERPTFSQLIQLIRQAVGSRAAVIRVPGGTVPALASVLNIVLRDRLLTREEYRAMADGLADTDGPATGTRKISEWIGDHGDTLGRRYANEIERHYRAAASPH
jgi:NADH dehydrogenase